MYLINLCVPSYKSYLLQLSWNMIIVTVEYPSAAVTLMPLTDLQRYDRPSASEAAFSTLDYGLSCRHSLWRLKWMSAYDEMAT